MGQTVDWGDNRELKWHQLSLNEFHRFIYFCNKCAALNSFAAICYKQNAPSTQGSDCSVSSLWLALIPLCHLLCSLLRTVTWYLANMVSLWTRPILWRSSAPTLRPSHTSKRPVWKAWLAACPPVELLTSTNHLTYVFSTFSLVSHQS